MISLQLNRDDKIPMKMYAFYNFSIALITYRAWSIANLRLYNHIFTIINDQFYEINIFFFIRYIYYLAIFSRDIYSLLFVIRVELKFLLKDIWLKYLKSYMLF